MRRLYRSIQTCRLVTHFRVAQQVNHIAYPRTCVNMLFRASSLVVKGRNPPAHQRCSVLSDDCRFTLQPCSHFSNFHLDLLGETLQSRCSCLTCKSILHLHGLQLLVIFMFASSSSSTHFPLKCLDLWLPW